VVISPLAYRWSRISLVDDSGWGRRRERERLVATKPQTAPPIMATIITAITTIIAPLMSMGGSLAAVGRLGLGEQQGEHVPQ
jgi:hypothetical protein